MFALLPVVALDAAPAGPAAGGSRAAERFRKADSDGSGALSRAEVERGALELAAQFDAIDRNRDGAVTPYELRAWRKAQREAQRNAARVQFDAHFARADADGDGALSKREAAAGLPAVARKFGQIDRDGDGQLSLAEMHAWLDARQAALRLAKKERAPR